MVAIFDAGKTNKKVFLFDEQYRLVNEQTTRLDEITDEDGYPCEDVFALTAWVQSSLENILSSREYEINAINFTSYGASFVHLNASGTPVFPLYNYLKPFPTHLQDELFEKYGGVENFTRQTASPVLGHLNSGLLLYRLQHEKGLTALDGYSLHLPQYLAYLVSGRQYSDITSIGCHTMLWNFDTNTYHRWVKEEAVSSRLAPIHPADDVININLNGKQIKVGIGLHDSSSALIPYLASFNDPFVLLSTGTWSISLNPFNNDPLTAEELRHDCLCYLTYQGRPVKASRLFAGHMHEEGVQKLESFYHKAPGSYKSIQFDEEKITGMQQRSLTDFATVPLDQLSFESAYHLLISDIILQQVRSTNLVMSPNVKQLFVDGGFSKNEIYMKLLASAYPQLKVFAASVAQATAMGAALAIHRHWNDNPVPSELVELVR